MTTDFFRKSKPVLKLFGYAGSKQKYLDIINNKINHSSKNIYIEPFLGSGVVFFNLEKSFDEYHIAEKEPLLFNMYEQLISNTSKDEFSEYVFEITKKYKLNNKTDFYIFRDYFNMSITDKKEKAFGLIIIITCCINNMFRVGPHGFNSSFGSRYLTYFKLIRIEDTISYLSKIKNKVVLYNDYKECITVKDSCQFIDPPYYLVPNSFDYWKEEHLVEMLERLNPDNDMIYTDVENVHGNIYFRYKQQLNKTVPCGPNKKKVDSKTILNEILYSNF